MSNSAGSTVHAPPSTSGPPSAPPSDVGPGPPASLPPSGLGLLEPELQPNARSEARAIALSLVRYMLAGSSLTSAIHGDHVRAVTIADDHDVTRLLWATFGHAFAALAGRPHETALLLPANDIGDA